MPSWIPYALIAVCTTIAIGWIVVRANELDLRIPYEPIFEIVETVSRVIDEAGLIGPGDAR